MASVAPEKPPVTLTLEWSGDLRFTARSPRAESVLDGDGARGLSPVQTLVAALAGCMAADVVFVLQKGRHPFRALTVDAQALRAPGDPHRLLSVELHFTLTGDVAPEKVERAIALSRETYCSVWHSLNPDIAFATAFQVVPAR